MSSMVELQGIGRENIIPALPELYPLLEQVSEWEGYDPLTVIGRVLTQEYQLLAIVKDGALIGVVATQIVFQSGEKGLRLVLASGSLLTEWISFEKILLEWCKAQSIVFVEGSGRPGWEKVLGSLGYRKTEVTLRKRL